MIAEAQRKPEEILTLRNLTMEKEEEEEETEGNFECNICLERVREPVVTLCGHLFCWQCIYRWLPHDHRVRSNYCPVCKANVSLSTLVPIYGRCHPSDPSDEHSDIVPRRPRFKSSGPAPNQPYYTFSMPDPVTGVVCEMVHRGLFGESVRRPRLSRRGMQTEQSLGRVYFFLLCCMVMCLLLF